jgi:hypothetical protein
LSDVLRAVRLTAERVGPLGEGVTELRPGPGDAAFVAVAAGTVVVAGVTAGDLVLATGGAGRCDAAGARRRWKRSTPGRRRPGR